MTEERIEWVDSTQLEDGRWMQLSAAVEMMGDLRQRTVGCVVAETDDALLVARTVSAWETNDTHEMIEGCLVIPKTAIVTRTELRPK